MKTYETFIFESYGFDKDKKLLQLRYSFDGELFFEENIEFPNSNRILNDQELEVLDNIFKYLHIAAGISYYKLFIPHKMCVKTCQLNREETIFFSDFYFNGLGEFSYKNSIFDLRERINFSHSNSCNVIHHTNLKLPDKVAIPIGGGKDSVVTLEIVKKYRDMNKIVLCSVGTAKSIEEIIRISGCSAFHPIRTVDKSLMELNKNLEEIGGYNGHVPISGILAFVLCASAVIYGFDTVLMSNERSASIGNIEFNGIVINHQWSKSFDFEKKINAFFKKYVLDSFNYVSFLRPLSEVRIAEIFSKLKEYHGIFTSCNKNFRIENRLDHWCCDCDKCRFVYLILAIFLTKKELKSIFGRNILEEKQQLDGFLGLCELKNHKPFECVGETEESTYAIMNVDESFTDDFVVKELRKRLVGKKHEKKDLFKLGKGHLLNKEMFGWLEDFSLLLPNKPI
ncbi:MAG: hypothetical protein LBS34_01790 [Rickettsiales bacterium]|jgi:hypothetical protein|nr:hypothetical protein [Rickettsiales bacterium]